MICCRAVFRMDHLLKKGLFHYILFKNTLLNKIILATHLNRTEQGFPAPPHASSRLLLSRALRGRELGCYLWVHVPRLRRSATRPWSLCRVAGRTPRSPSPPPAALAHAAAGSRHGERLRQCLRGVAASSLGSLSLVISMRQKEASIHVSCLKLMAHSYFI